jgi:hypothetical protein
VGVVVGMILLLVGMRMEEEEQQHVVDKLGNMSYYQEGWV